MMVNGHILIVHREEETRDLLAFLFKEAGYAVTKTGSTAGALPLLSGVDLVVSSGSSVFMSGTNFLKHVGRIPVVVILSTEDEYTQKKIGRSGAYCIRKPFGFEDLAGMAEILLRPTNLEVSHASR